MLSTAEAAVAPPQPPTAKSKGKSKRKKKKGKAPPYKTYEVVTPNGDDDDGPPTVVRMVNAFDVLLVDYTGDSSHKELYDFSRQPGNQRYRKFVDLSQAHFETMSNEKKASGGDTAIKNEPDENEDEKQQELARNVVKTIREQWGGLFLRRVDPMDANGTHWTEVGIDESVEKVLQLFKENFQKKRPEEQKPQVFKVEQSELQQADQHTHIHENAQQLQEQHQQESAHNSVHFPPQSSIPVQAQTPGTAHAGLGIIQDSQAQQAILNGQFPAQTPVGNKMPRMTAATPNLQGLTPLPPALRDMSPGLAFATQPSPGMAFAQQFQLPSTPAMPPLGGGGSFSAARRHPLTPICPQLPSLPGMANPDVVMHPPAAATTTAVLPPAPAPAPNAAPPVPAPTNNNAATTGEVPVKRKRGRPRKGEVRPPKKAVVAGPKRGRGRPRKYPRPENAPPKPKPKTKKQKELEKQKREQKKALAATQGEQLGTRGRHRIVPLPEPRKASTLAPPPPSPNQNGDAVGGDGGGGGAFLLSPSEDFRFEDSPDLNFPESPKPRQGTTTYVSPPRPSSPLPYPSPAREVEASSQVEQAKAFLKVKDPIWLSNYTKLTYCRITMYCHGHMTKWVGGNVRYITKKDSLHGADTPLNNWVADQQAMYREYCAWEERKHLEASNQQQAKQQQQQPPTQDQEQAPTLQNMRQHIQQQMHPLEHLQKATSPPPAAPTAAAATAETQLVPAATTATSPNATTATATETQDLESSKPVAAEPSKEEAPTAGKSPAKENDKTKGRTLRSRIQRKRTKQRLPRAAKATATSGSSRDKGEDAESLSDDADPKNDNTAKGAGAKVPPREESSKEKDDPDATNETKEVTETKNPEASAKYDAASSSVEDKAPVEDAEAPAEEPADAKAKEAPDSNITETRKASDADSVMATALPTGDAAGSDSQSELQLPVGLKETTGAPSDPGDNVWVLPDLDGETAPVLNDNHNVPTEDRAETERKMQKLREVERAKILLLDDVHFVWQPDQKPPADAPKEWVENFYDLREYVRCRGDTAVSDNVELGAWAQLQRMQFQRSLAMMTNESPENLQEEPDPPVDAAEGSSQTKRPPLSRGQMAALRGLGFDWDDLESSQFYVMYLKLIEFKSRVGDCLVPPPYHELQLEEDDDEDDDVIVATRADPKLFYWVQRQRMEYVRFLRAKEIAEHRAAGVDEDGHALVLELLEEGGDMFEENSAKKRKPMDHNNDDDYITGLADLVRTPAKSAPNHGPGSGQMVGQKVDTHFDTGKENWYVNANGKRRKKYVKSRKDPLSKAKRKVSAEVLKSSDSVSTLTQAQVDLLDAAGFIWSMDISILWILQYRRLHAFYIKHGHCKVTKSTNEAKTKLNRWCTNVRQLYQRNLHGKDYGLAPEKFTLLERLGFSFEFDDLPPKHSFEERFQWLLEYKEREGHVKVPQRHPFLGHFVKRLRKEYEANKRGVKTMNPDKIRRLEEIGFKWRVRRHRGWRKASKKKTDKPPKNKRGDDSDEDSDSDSDDDSDSGDEESTVGEIMVPAKVKSPPPNPYADVLPKKRPSPSDDSCSVCYGTIICAFAKCESCRSAYCQECFEETRADEHRCSNCKGTVFPTAAGWAI